MKKKSYKINKDQKTEYFDHKENFTHQNLQGKLVSILPHPITLESYEEICPGITENLTKMILKEQEHRHRIEKIKLRKSSNFYYFGQILTLFLIIVVIYSFFVIMDLYDNPYLAGTFSVSAFTFLTLVNYFAMKGRCKQQSQQDKNYFKRKTSSHKHHN